MKKVKLVLIGAGDRGTTYATFGKEACSDDFEMVAVADPDPIRRNHIKELFSIPDENCFEYGEELLSLPKMADAAIIATQDQQHFALAKQAILKGYHLLLEKPAATTPMECMEISELAHQMNVMVLVCHVLRYTPFFRLLKQLISDGRIGKVMNIIHIECVGNIHQSHSYVRGNWHNSRTSSPMILAKSCHDLDIIQWLLEEHCTRLQSFGSLSYFRTENMPEGAPEYCIQGCPAGDTCPYNAIHLYQHRKATAFLTTATKHLHPTDEDLLNTITNTDYGKCVFRCDNDVVDHQTVNLEYEDGATVSFTMSAFNRGGRSIRIMGTEGEITAAMADDHITLFRFDTRTTEQIKISDAIRDESISGGHGGGDRGIIRTFIRLLNGTYQGNTVSDISTSIENHLVAFAAEESRLNGTVINMEEYLKKLKESLSASDTTFATTEYL